MIKMKQLNQLHPTVDWEKRKPRNVEFTHFLYAAKAQLVRKVEGVIRTAGTIFAANGENKTVRTVHRVYWDGYGYCFMQAKRACRVPKYDINFKSHE